MLIAQITDTHIRAAGAMAFQGSVDTSARLRATVAFLGALAPAPDAVIATGDLADTASAGDYVQLVELLRPLRAPVFPIPGNHDAREPLRAAFPALQQRAPEGFLQYVVDELPVRLVALDTLQDYAVGGLLCRWRLDWIERTLSESTRPTVMFMHHPPYAFGAQSNEDMTCAGAGELERIVRAHGHVIAVLCGHLHRFTTLAWGGTVACTVPATAPVLQLDLGGGHPQGWIDTPPMVGLHLWRPAGLVSHVVAVDEAARFRPFDVAGAA